MPILSWPEKERPRERLLAQGPESVSDAEILAILLRTGLPGKDAVSLSREILAKFGGFRGLLGASSKELQKIKGLGAAKRAMLMAAAEMARRKLREELTGKNFIRDPESVMTYLMTAMRDRKREVFKILFLDKANRILSEADLFEGTVDQAAVHPREVVKTALERHATAIVLVHNHPSGRAEPSPEDRTITARLSSALNTIGVTVLDHLIVGDNRHFSFREHGML